MNGQSQAVEDKESLPFLSGDCFWLVGDRFPELQAGRQREGQVNRGTGDRGVQGPPAVPSSRGPAEGSSFSTSAAAPVACGPRSREPALPVIATGEKSHTL